MAQIVRNNRRRLSIIELTVVIGILVVLAATVVTLVGNHLDRPGEVIPTVGQAPHQTTIEADGPMGIIG